VGGGGDRERLGERGGTGRCGRGGGSLEGISIDESVELDELRRRNHPGMSIDESEEFELVDALLNTAPPAAARTEGETLEVRLRSIGLPEEVVQVHFLNSTLSLDFV
jgi:hypothetical protein